MKKIFSLLMSSIIYGMALSQVINVSTGISSSGGIDANWKVSTSTPASGNAFLLSTSIFAGIWEPTPVSGTNAKWLSVAANTWGAGQTNYFYERKFTVPAGVGKLAFRLKVAYDDLLHGLALIKPDGTSIPLTVVHTASYRLSREIVDSLLCPPQGVWTIRANVFCADAQNRQGPTGFLLSGNIQLTEGRGCRTQETPNPCCPPWSADRIETFFKYKGIGGIGDPYVLVFDPPMQWQLQMQSYINYLHSINPSINAIAIEFRLHNQGTGTVPNTSAWGTQIGPIGFIRFTANGNNSVSTLVNAIPINFFGNGVQIPGTWYAITTGTYLNDNLHFFPRECAENTKYVRVQTMGMKVNSSSQPQSISLEFSNGKTIVESKQIETETKQMIEREGIMKMQKRN